MTHLRRGVQPRAGLGCSSPDFIHENSTSLHLPPPPPAPAACHTVQLFHFRKQGLQKFALQPPDSSASQLETAASLVRSPLAELNIEPSAAVRDLINSSFKVCIMLSGLKDQSPRPCYFPVLFVDLSLLEYSISVMVCCRAADVFNKLYCASVRQLPPTLFQACRKAVGRGKGGMIH